MKFNQFNFKKIIKNRKKTLKLIFKKKILKLKFCFKFKKNEK